MMSSFRYRVMGMVAAATVVLVYMAGPFPVKKVELLRMVRSERGETDDPLSVVAEVLSRLDEEYVTPDRLRPSEMLSVFLTALERQLPSFIVERSGTFAAVKYAGRQVSLNISGQSSMFDLFWNIRTVTTGLGLADERTTVYRAVGAMLATLDPHTVLLMPEEYQELKAGSEGEFSGIGVVVTQRGGQAVVIAPIDDTPAAGAGIRAGDIIVRIDGVPLDGVPLTEVVKLLRGEPGTMVTLWIMRSGVSRLLRFELERSVIQLKSVSWRRLGGDTALIRIKQFNQHTYDEVRNVLIKLKKSKIKHLILDMCNNPGGLVLQAAKVADLFVSSGLLFYTRTRAGVVQKVYARHETTIWNSPVIVLVNSGTASSAEIVSGALKESGSALIVGERTFGKGSIQTVYENEDGSALKMTVAHYILRHDVAIDGVGITPSLSTRLICTGCEVQNVLVSGRSNVVSDKPDFSVELPVSASEMNTFGGAPARVVKLAALLFSSLSDRILDRRALAATVDRIRRRNAEELVELLGTRGIDWSEGACDATSVNMDVSIPSRWEVGTGFHGNIRLSVSADASPVHRLGITITGPSGETVKEILVGRMTAGQVVQKKLSFDTSRFRIPGNYTLNVRLICGDRLIRQKNLKIEGFRKGAHSIVVHYRVLDDIRGDADGILEPGEVGRIHVVMANKGDVPASEVTASLQVNRPSIVSVEGSSKTVYNLAPGEEISLDYTVELHRSVHGFTGRKAPLMLHIATDDGDEDLSQNLLLYERSAYTAPLIPSHGVIRIPRDTLLYGSALGINPIGRALGGSRFAVLQETGGFLKVMLTSYRWAFVHASDAEEVRDLPAPAWMPFVSLAAPDVRMSYSGDAISIEITHPAGISSYMVDIQSMSGVAYKKLVYKRGNSRRKISILLKPERMSLGQRHSGGVILRVRGWSTSGGVRTLHRLMNFEPSRTTDTAR